MEYGDSRLMRLFTREPLRCVTIDDYAAAAGMTVFDVLLALTPAKEAGHISFDNQNGTFYVNTAPNGRNDGLTHPPANLWEQLRTHYPAYEAARVWTLSQTLKRAGWLTEVRPAILTAHYSGITPAIRVAAISQERNLPVCDYPALTDITNPYGIIQQLSTKHITVALILIPEYKLDDYITAARSWYLEHPYAASKIALCEAPTFNPVLLSANDVSVAPRSVTLEELSNIA